jgi:hypothetical protein
MELEEDSILMEETAGSEFETESDNDGSTHSPPAKQRKVSIKQANAYH